MQYSTQETLIGFTQNSVAILDYGKVILGIKPRIRRILDKLLKFRSKLKGC